MIQLPLFIISGNIEQILIHGIRPSKATAMLAQFGMVLWILCIMNRNYIIIIGIVLVLIGCGVTFVTMSAGAVTWAVLSEEALQPTLTPELARRKVAMVKPTFTNTPTSPPTPTATASPTLTATPTDTPLPTDTPVPPTNTPTVEPPTNTPEPTATNTPLPPPPPTNTPEPTPTPVPSFPFEIAEHETFPTSHLNFDVYIGVTDTDNHPLTGYRIIGTHSNGQQIESRESARDWTENSGAMWYKAGNIKYEAMSSPQGTWTLQLVDNSGQPVAPPIAFQFNPDDPTWYFLLYRRVN